MSSFNHSMQDCWYWSKHDVWPPGGGSVSRIENDCAKVYGNGVDPAAIGPENRAYVCYGVHPSTGYVGSCWNGTNWTSDACVDLALKKYCGILEIPEVTDPSDQAGMTGEFWNIPRRADRFGGCRPAGPALAGDERQNCGRAAPSGLIQEVKDDIRIGAMVFNDEGSASECTRPDKYILYKCSDPTNKDGSKIIYDIGQGTSHTQGLVSAINSIKATSWTPAGRSPLQRDRLLHPEQRAAAEQPGLPPGLRPGDRLVPEQQYLADHRRRLDGGSELRAFSHLPAPSTPTPTLTPAAGSFSAAPC